MAKSERQNFMQGALILMLSNLIVKVIGACFKIPLTHLLHEEGMAVFNTAYQVYAALFAISTTGLPIAVSVMVSKGMAEKRIGFCRKVFRVSFLLLGTIGLAGSLVLFFGAPYLAAWMGDSMAEAGILAIAPSLLFICLASCCRGYFQGMQDMRPTAVSQLIEALCKLLLGFSLAYLLMLTARKNAAIAETTVSYGLPAAGAVLGITIGIVLSALYLMLRYIRFSRKLNSVPTSDTDTTALRTIAKQLIRIAVPITAGACVSSLTAVVDTAMIRVRLQGIVFDAEQAKRLLEWCKVVFYDYENVFAGFRENFVLNEGAARWLYGALSGYASSLFNLPATVILALGMSLVPAISSALAAKNQLQAQRAAHSAIRLTLLFSLPCAAALAASAGPILRLILNNDSSEHMLQILAPACVCVTLTSITTSILQASGHTWIPVRNMLSGGLVKIGLNYFLIGNPNLHIFGAPISTALCYLLISVLNLQAVKRTMGIRFEVGRSFLRPASAGLLMGAALWMMNVFVPELLPSRLQTLLILTISLVFYVILLFLMRAVQKEDIEMLPKGKKIAKVLAKCGVIG